MRQITVAVEPCYNVYVGNGVLDKLPEYLKALSMSSKCAVITDSNVARLYLDTVKEMLNAHGFEVYTYEMIPGENSKNMATLADILEFFAKSELSRGDFAIALGGGVVGDLTGFASGCYMRGIDYVQIPTSLLAAVDSSVGGKTAVNLDGGKNLAGLFKQPRLVLCDVSTLKTLPEKTYKEGLAEAIKTGILSGEALFSLLEEYERSEGWLEEVISGCVAYKASIVSRDPEEKGERKLLNLGHTPAHGIEKLSGYAISHGEAVAMGIRMILECSSKEGLLLEKSEERIIKLLDREKFPKNTMFNGKELARQAKNDKKRKGDKIFLVLPLDIGKCEIREYTLEELEYLYE